MNTIVHNNWLLIRINFYVIYDYFLLVIKVKEKIVIKL